MSGFLLSEQARVDTRLGAHHHHSRYFHADSVGDVLRLRLQLHPQVNPRPQNHEGECRPPTRPRTHTHIFYLSHSTPLNGWALEWNLILLTHWRQIERTHYPSGSQMLVPTQALRKSDFALVKHICGINLCERQEREFNAVEIFVLREFTEMCRTLFLKMFFTSE
jgi:hypothetical protein